MGTYTLYHGNTKKVIDDIINAKQLLPIYKSTGPKHYLGDGYYFYDDPVQAKVWAIMKVTRNEKYKGKPWAVLKCEVEVDDDKIFDLDNRVQQDFFFEEMFQLQQQIKNGELEIEQYRDTFLCNHLARILNIDLFSKTFPYLDKGKIVPSLFSNENPKLRGDLVSYTRHFRTETQYCLRNEALIISPINYEYGTIK